MLTCPNCNAPLHQGAPGATIECRFCHVQTRIPPQMPLPMPPQVVFQVGHRPVTPVRPTVSPALILVPMFIAVGIGFAVAIFGTLRAKPTTTSKTSPFNMPTIPGMPGTQPKGGIKPTEIPASIEKGGDFGWVDLDAPGMKGTFANFDVIGNVPWAVSIAKYWSSDAELESLYLTGVRPDGTMDLSGQDNRDADYRFVSKSLVAAQEKLKEVSEKKLVLEFRIMVSKGKATFLANKPLIQSRIDVGPQPPVFSCPLAKALEIAKSANLAPRPTYTGMARWNSYRKTWSWYFSGDGTSSNKQPSIDTCKG